MFMEDTYRMCGIMASTVSEKVTIFLWQRKKSGLYTWGTFIDKMYSSIKKFNKKHPL